MGFIAAESWREQLLARLERGIGRSLRAVDLPCVVWHEANRTLTVHSPPLLSELRAQNLISNVFRSRVSRG